MVPFPFDSVEYPDYTVEDLGRQEVLRFSDQFQIHLTADGCIELHAGPMQGVRLDCGTEFPIGDGLINFESTSDGTFKQLDLYDRTDSVIPVQIFVRLEKAIRGQNKFHWYHIHFVDDESGSLPVEMDAARKLTGRVDKQEQTPPSEPTNNHESPVSLTDFLIGAYSYQLACAYGTVINCSKSGNPVIQLQVDDGPKLVFRPVTRHGENISLERGDRIGGILIMPVDQFTGSLVTIFWSRGYLISREHLIGWLEFSSEYHALYTSDEARAGIDLRKIHNKPWTSGERVHNTFRYYFEILYLTARAIGYDKQNAVSLATKEAKRHTKQTLGRVLPLNISAKMCYPLCDANFFS